MARLLRSAASGLRAVARAVVLPTAEKQSARLGRSGTTSSAVAPRFPRLKAGLLLSSQALLSSLVLRAPPLCGERLLEALRVAERDLVRAVEEGDAPAVADLRLLLAFLAARAGRFDDALARYAEMARDDPSDSRPHFLAATICALARRPEEEGEKWCKSYERLGAPELDPGLMTLVQELAVAVALGGSPTAFDERFPYAMFLTVAAAGNRVDAALLSALRGKEMSAMERLQLRAARAFMYAGMSSAIKGNPAAAE